jgi:hypothetical protein
LVSPLLPLADAVAIAFVSPLVVTLLSVVVLHEHVGPRRWAAVAAGLVGVLIMMRPGAGALHPAAVLVFISAFTYASTHMMTRRLRDTESAATLNFYVQMRFHCGQYLHGPDRRRRPSWRASGNASLEFLFRPWVWPPGHRTGRCFWRPALPSASAG